MVIINIIIIVIIIIDNLISISISIIIVIVIVMVLHKFLTSVFPMQWNIRIKNPYKEINMMYLNLSSQYQYVWLQ